MLNRLESMVYGDWWEVQVPENKPLNPKTGGGGISRKATPAGYRLPATGCQPCSGIQNEGSRSATHRLRKPSEKLTADGCKALRLRFSDP
jgi:hypothetical protein